MDLQEWIDKSGNTRLQFAKEIGVPNSTVSDWCMNGHVPRPHHMAKIVTFTKGAVSPSSFYPKADSSHADDGSQDDSD